jgi:hypothetical protein
MKLLLQCFITFNLLNDNLSLATAGGNVNNKTTIINITKTLHYKQL